MIDLATHALHDIRGHLEQANLRERACGLPALHRQDKTWKERAGELCLRASYLAEFVDRDDLESASAALDALGAQVVAMKMAIIATQDTRVP